MIAAECVRAIYPGANKNLPGAVPVGLVGSAYGAHLHLQATEISTPNGFVATLSFPETVLFQLVSMTGIFHVHC